MNLRHIIGLGVAGNFAHHLEQAGEMKDFENVVTKEAHAPKGIFPFYLPGDAGFLGIYPVNKETLRLPEYEANAQVEPEIVILFDIHYDLDYNVIRLDAKSFTAFNDCTIRKEGAKKISEKKSWSTHSKGIGSQWIEIDKFSDGGIMNHYHLCSFLKRDGVLHEYGVDAPLVGYSYFYEKLTDWLMEKMNEQEDHGPLEDVGAHLLDCGHPGQAFIAIGATAYAEFGENNYLQSGDEIFVITYDARYSKGDLTPSDDKIILSQRVV